MTDHKNRTAQYLIDEQPKFATAAGKTLLSAEIGWPTDAMAGGSLTLNGSIASIPNAQKLLDTFVCAANKNVTAGGPYGSGYFWFGAYLDPVYHHASVHVTDMGQSICRALRPRVEDPIRWC